VIRALAAPLLLAACATAPVYDVPRAASPPRIDGRLDDAAWRAAPPSAGFRDIEGGRRPAPPLSTRVRLLWDDDALYVAAEIEEPDVWATIVRHDDVIFRNDDFEVFLDPDRDGRDYLEIEVNAYGTTWDLALPRPYREGGSAQDGWESLAVVGVAVDGTRNDPRDRDRGWTVEMAIPWAAFEGRVRGALPPRPGDEWAADFSRVDWETEVVGGVTRPVPGRPERNWAWAPTGIVDMHLPWRWGTLRFLER